MSTEKVRVCLLTGNFYQRHDVLSKIKEQLQGCEWTTLGSEVTFEYLYGQVFSSSCFSEQRVFEINDYPKYKETQPTFMKKFKSMLEKVPSDCLVVLNGINASSAFVEFIQKIGRSYCFDQYISRQVAPAFVIRELQKNEKKIEEENADLLVESLKLVDYTDNKRKVTGVNLDDIFLLLKKLNSYIGNRKVINKEDVLAVCIDSKDFVIWNLMNAIDERDHISSILMIDKALSNENKIFEDSHDILITMNWRFKCLLFIKECLALKMNEDQIKYEISQLYKIKRKGLAEKMTIELSLNKEDKPQPVYSEAMVMMNLRGRYGHKPSIACYNRKELFMLMTMISDAMVKIRIGCTKTEAFLIFDSIFMLLNGQIDYEQSKKMREISNGKFY